MVSFSLAVDRDFKDKSTGERNTDFIDVVAWRQTAEFVSRFFTKGRIQKEGRLQIRDWTDKDGGKRRSAEVIADNVYFGDAKRDGEAVAPPAEAIRAAVISPPAGDTTAAVATPDPPAATHPPPPPMGSAGNEFNDIADDDGELPF